MDDCLVGLHRLGGIVQVLQDAGPLKCGVPADDSSCCLHLMRDKWRKTAPRAQYAPSSLFPVLVNFLSHSAQGQSVSRSR